MREFHVEKALRAPDEVVLSVIQSEDSGRLLFCLKTVEVEKIDRLLKSKFYRVLPGNIVSHPFCVPL